MTLLRKACRRSRHGDPASRIAARLLGELGQSFSCTASRESDWASAIFTGTRHRLRLEGHGPDAFIAANALARRIGGIEFAMDDCFVADIAVHEIVREADGRVVMAIEALSVAC